MSEDRLVEFNQHRAEILKAHLMRDKTYLAVRRKRRLNGVLGAVQVIVGTFGVLAVMKSLMLATNTPSEYAQIIAPALQGLDAGHPFARALLPDDLTQSVAEALRPMLAKTADTDIAFGPPMPPGMVDVAATPES